MFDEQIVALKLPRRTEKVSVVQAVQEQCMLHQCCLLLNSSFPDYQTS